MYIRIPRPSKAPYKRLCDESSVCLDGGLDNVQITFIQGENIQFLDENIILVFLINYNYRDIMSYNVVG